MIPGDVPFSRIDWSLVPPTTRGATGTARERKFERGGVRVRLVEYEPGYLPDHWCVRGHVVHVLAGRIETELRDGRTFTLAAGETYCASDGEPAHRSRSPEGAQLLIVD